MNELTQTLKRHFEPKPLVIAERFHFHRRNQIATESVSEYVAQLRRLATHCEFGEFLNDALRDRLVCGLNNTSAQKRLLSEATLTLAKAVEIAQSMEAAEKSSKVFHEGEGGAVGQLNTQRSSGSRLNDSLPPGKPSCHRCKHSPDSCRFKMAICHKCKKRGHLARMCRSVSSKKNVSYLEEEEQEGSQEEEDLPVLRLEAGPRHPIVVDLQVKHPLSHTRSTIPSALYSSPPPSSHLPLTSVLQYKWSGLPKTPPKGLLETASSAFL